MNERTGVTATAESARTTRRLRIGVEAHVVGRRQTGNERVVSNLLLALERAGKHDVVAYFTDGPTAETWRRKAPGIDVRVVRPTNPLARIPISLPVLAHRDRLDALISHVNGPPFAPCPVVTLIHDVAFARHPEFFSRFQRAYMNVTVRASMRWADAVVAVSQFTKDEAVALFRFPAERVTVAHNGVDDVFDNPSEDPVVPPPFFLAAGNLEPRKNLATLVGAYRHLVARRPEIPERLVLVGQFKDAAPLLAASADLVQSGRLILPGYVSDEELASLCHAATAFAYPSVYEGFGLPPLEAMAAGAPTLVADIPVMREVVGDNGVRLPAKDPTAWRRAMERIIDDPEHRRSLIDRGRRHAASFTWDAQATAIARVIEGITGMSRRAR